MLIYSWHFTNMYKTRSNKTKVYVPFMPSTEADIDDDNHCNKLVVLLAGSARSRTAMSAIYLYIINHLYLDLHSGYTL